MAERLSKLAAELGILVRDGEALQAARANAATEVLVERSVKQELLFLITESWYGIHEATAAEASAPAPAPKKPPSVNTGATCIY